MPLSFIPAPMYTAAPPPPPPKPVQTPAPIDVRNFLIAHGWEVDLLSVYWQLNTHDIYGAPSGYFTWTEALAYEVFRRFTLEPLNASS